MAETANKTKSWILEAAHEIASARAYGLDPNWKFDDYAAQMAEIIAKHAVADWIAVSERLPEMGSRVLVFTPVPQNELHYGAFQIMATVWNTSEPNHKGGYYLGLGPGQMVAITHWQPLPDPPVADQLGERK